MLVLDLNGSKLRHQRRNQWSFIKNYKSLNFKELACRFVMKDPQWMLWKEPEVFGFELSGLQAGWYRRKNTSLDSKSRLHKTHREITVNRFSFICNYSWRQAPPTLHERLELLLEESLFLSPHQHSHSLLETNQPPSPSLSLERSGDRRFVSGSLSDCSYVLMRIVLISCYKVFTADSSSRRKWRHKRSKSTSASGRDHSKDPYSSILNEFLAQSPLKDISPLGRTH